jgi:2-polyprenyl-6-methoxyphenol hydroxylase-like FAD-dependent oxidoreductase
VPFFPPIEKVEQYTRVRCEEIVRKAMFGSEASGTVPIEIKNVNTWRLEAVVADSYVAG